MRRLILISAGFLAASATAAFAQNEMHHFDGTLEFVSRGSNSVNAKTLLQRLPADQICGAQALTDSFVFLQDQDFNTPETFTLELRGNNPAGPATGSPDMSAAGLIGTSGPIPLTFPTPTTGVGSAVIIQITYGAPIPIPSTPTVSVPANDVYVGVAFGPAPNWPTLDGISTGASGTTTTAPVSPGEQMNPTAVGYTGTVGAAGLGWQADLTLLTAPSLGTANRAWYHATRWTNAVLQPSAHNNQVFTGNSTTLAGPNGANPNFGYAGLWPWEQRPGGPDNIGFRARFTAPVGTPCTLLIGFAPLATPLHVGGVQGVLCINPSPLFFIVETKNTTAAPASQPSTTSQVQFGSYPGDATWPTGVSIYAQALLQPASGPKVFSSMCKMTL